MILASLFDILKRYRFRGKYAQLTMNAVVNSSSNTSATEDALAAASESLLQQQAGGSQQDPKDFDQLYMAHLASKSHFDRLIRSLNFYF